MLGRTFRSLLFGATVAALWGCARYETACTIGESEDLVTFAGPSDSYQIRRLAEERVLVVRTNQTFPLGPGPEPILAKVDTVRLTRSGEIEAQHHLVSSRAVADAISPWTDELVWLDDKLAIVSQQGKRTVDTHGAAHLAQELTVAIYDQSGLWAGPASIPGSACTDCELDLSAISLGGEVVVLWSQYTHTSTENHFSWAAIGADGVPRSWDVVGGLAADEEVNVRRFGRPHRSDAQVLMTSQNRAWLVDNRFRPLTPALSWNLRGEWDWDSAHQHISRVWSVISMDTSTAADILTDQVSFAGEVQLPEDRISMGGSILDVAETGGSLGILRFGGSSKLYEFSARSSEGIKLGGDVPFPFVSDTNNAIKALRLVPAEKRSFHLYSIESSGPLSDVLKRRKIVCQP
jgi:hypothetical protein